MRKKNEKKEIEIKEEILERRQYKRISKNFILTYFDKTDPSKKFEITQLKNISMGGMCFITTYQLKSSTLIGVELKTPYLAEKTYLEGVVQESHEKVKNILYETRLKFSFLDAQAEFLMAKLIEFFVTGDTESHE